VYEGVYGNTGGQTIVQEVRIHSYVILAMKPGVLDEDASAGPKIQIAVGGEETTVEEVEGFKNDEGADEGGLGCVVVRGEDACQAIRKSILKSTERKVLVRANANCPTTGNKMRDPKIVGKLPVLVLR
jgi:hypothetical protein